MTRFSKAFAGTKARTDISLEVQAGKVLCLRGHNGAGKSTLITVLSRLHTPPSGTYEINGMKLTLNSSRDAGVCGIFNSSAARIGARVRRHGPHALLLQGTS